jgi:DNA-binding Lrp family transcriptional regulator
MLIMVQLESKNNPNKVWDFITQNFERYSHETVTPLFISQAQGKTDINLVLSVEKIEAIIKFLSDQVGKCDAIENTKTTLMLKTVFLPIPKEHLEVMKRYTISLFVSPKYYHHVYDSVIEHRYTAQTFPTNVAYTPGESDIYISMVGPDFDIVDEFVNENIYSIKGVNEYTIDFIKRSKLLSDEQVWYQLQKNLLYIPSWLTGDELKKKFIYEYDFSPADDFALTGAMIDEL